MATSDSLWVFIFEEAIKLFEYLYKKHRILLFLLLIIVAAAIVAIVAYIFLNEGTIGITKLEQSNIDYAKEEGYIVHGNSNKGKKNKIYIICKKPETDVWTVLCKAESQETDGSWKGICFLDNVTGNIEVGDKYQIKAIMTKKGLDVHDKRYLPKLNNTELKNFPKQSNCLDITIASAVSIK